MFSFVLTIHAPSFAYLSMMSFRLILLLLLLIPIIYPTTLISQIRFTPHFSGTYFGGSQDDPSNSVAIRNDRIYITGTTNDTAFEVTPGCIQSVHGGSSDLYLSAFDTSGTLIWSTFLGGNGYELYPSLKIDTNGFLYLSAVSNSNNFPVSSGAYQSTSGGQYDAVLLKITDTGALVWSTFFGGSNSDLGIDLNLDEDGNIVLAGQTASTDFPVSTGAHQTLHSGANDAFVARFNSSGSMIWSTYYGGTQSEDIHAVAIDKQKNIFVTGMTMSTDLYLTAGAQQPGLAGGFDIYLASFDSNGVVRWSTYHGGYLDDDALGMTCDSSGSVYVSGKTFSTDFPVTTNAWQDTLRGAEDAIVSGFENNGNLIFSSYLGSTLNDAATKILDGTGNKMFLLLESEGVLPPTDTSLHDIPFGGSDAWLLQFDSQDFSLNFSSYFGGSMLETAAGLALDDTNIVFCGITMSPNLDFGNLNPYQTSHGGGLDAYWAMISINHVIPIDTTDTTDTSGIIMHHIDPFTIYPNPASNYFSLLNDPCDEGTINLLNFDGKLIRKYSLNNVGYDLTGIKSGAYVIQRDAENCYWRKILIVQGGESP